MRNFFELDQKSSDFVRFFRQQGKAGTIVYPLLPLFLYALPRFNEHPLFTPAFVCTLLFALVRLFLLYATRIVSESLFLKLYPAIVLINAAMIGSFGFIVFDYKEDPSGIILYTLFVSSLVGGGFIAMAENRILALGNSIVLLTPLVIGFATFQSGASQFVMALAGLIYIPFGFRQLKSMRSVLMDLKASRAEILFQQQRQSQFINQIPGMISWFDQELNYVDCNDNLLQKIGLKKQEIIGKKIGHRSERSQFRDSFLSFAESGVSQKLHELILTMNGVTTTYLTLFCKFENNNKVEYSALSFDISAIKEKEIEIERQKIHLMQQEKMVAMGEMASGIAHEVNNPLAIIAGKAEILQTLLQTNRFTAETGIKHLETITKTSFRISKIISGLRLLAKDSRLTEMNDYKIEEIIEPIFDINHAKLKNAGIHLRLSLSNPKELVRCSLVEISQVLLNLIINASHAIESLDEKWIHVEITDFDNQVEMRIADSGSGIPEEVRKKLFQPFFTTKAPGKGTGIGLSLSRELMRKQGGDLYLDASAQHTTFVIKLEKAAQKPSNTEEAA